MLTGAPFFPTKFLIQHPEGAERLLDIPVFLAFGLQYALEARLGSLNIFLFDGVRPLLEPVLCGPRPVQWSISSAPELDSD